MTPLDLAPGTSRHNLATGLYGIMLGNGREIVAVGEGAEEAVRAAYPHQLQAMSASVSSAATPVIPAAMPEARDGGPLDMEGV